MKNMNTTPNLTLNEWLDEWYKSYSLPYVKQATAVAYEGYIRNHIVPFLGDKMISSIRLTDLQLFFNAEAEKYSPKTVRNVRNMLHMVMDVAYLNDLIDKNYVEYVKIPTVNTPEMRVFTMNEEKTLLAELNRTDEQFAIGIFSCLMTGIRVGELCGLQWKHIDFDEQEIKIRQTLQRLPKLNYNGKGNKTEVVIGPPKSKESVRNVDFDDRTKQKLFEYRKQKIRRFGSKIVDDEQFFIAPIINKLTEPRTMQDVFKRILIAAHIKDANFHALRHTFATRALEAGIDFKTLSKILGHSDINVTMNRYAHVLKDAKKAAIKTISDSIFGNDNNDLKNNDNKELKNNN